MNTSAKEPILINGVSVAAIVGATIAVLERFGAPVLEGDGALATLFISVVVIPLGTWILARRKTVTVARANDHIVTAASGGPAETFRVGQ